MGGHSHPHHPIFNDFNFRKSAKDFKAKLEEFARIPSREGLYTMLAGGMIGIVKDLSIALNLLAEQKEN